MHLNKWKVCLENFLLELRSCFIFIGRSSITRASSFFEISDLSEEEAMIYLTEKRNFPKEVAQNLHALFGGRIKSLQNAASKLESGVEFSSKSNRYFFQIKKTFGILLAIRKSTLQDTARRIEKIKCRANTQEQTFLFNVLYGLLHRSELTADELIKMEQDVTIRQKILDELRNETILMRSVSTGSYVYHSQVIRVCIKEFYKDKFLQFNMGKI
jgi:flagellar biosynthesis chaperone FliJ